MNYQTEDGTKSPFASFDLKGNFGEVYKLQVDRQDENESEFIEYCNKNLECFQQRINANLHLNSSDETICSKVSNSREMKSQRLMEDTQIPSSVTKSLNCYPNCITVAGCETCSINVANTENNVTMRCAHNPLSVESDRKIFNKEIAKINSKGEEGLPMHDTASRGSILCPIPIPEPINIKTASLEPKKKVKKGRIKKALPKMKEVSAVDLLPPLVKAFDMQTFYNVDLSTEKFLNHPVELNFVKGSDLVQTEIALQIETDILSFEHLGKDEKGQTEENFLKLLAEKLAASGDKPTIPSHDKNLILESCPNSSSLAVPQPDVSVTAFALGPSVVISTDSSDLQQLLDQLNNDASDLNKKLLVIYPEYLPVKIPVRSCGSESNPCPFKENCPAHKRKSLEDNTSNKMFKLDEPTSHLPKNKDSQADERAEYSSISLVLKDLSKAVINSHVKRINELYKWMKYDETFLAFSCQECSYEVGDSSYEMGIVQVNHCVGDFKLNYFYDLCKEHSNSHFHRISVILKKKPRIFKAIKFILMNSLEKFFSLDELIKEMRFTFKEDGDPEWEGALFNLIELIRSLNERQMLFLVRQLNLPVSFILDFCKGFAIMRFVLLTGEPIEYALVIGTLSVKSFNYFLQAINVNPANVIFFKVLEKCGCCSNCDFTSVLNEVGSPLPVRFPSVKELLLLIQEDNRLGNIFRFSKGIFLLYEEFPQKFKEIEGVFVLKKFKTCFWPVLEFVLKEQEKLKEVCLTIFLNNGNITALGLAKYPLYVEADLKIILEKIKLTCLQVRNLTSRCERETSFINQLPSSFQSLFNNVSKSSDVDESLRGVLSNFIFENSRKFCCCGRKDVSDFEFLTYPSALMALNSCPKLVDTFKKIYTLAKPFVKEEPQKVLEDLQLFGKYLFDTFDAYCIPLNDILKVFRAREFVRENFPLSHTFYFVVGTLPFFPAYVERSIYYTWNTCVKFNEKFGKDVGYNLSMIYLQQQDLPLLKSNLTAYCMRSLMENSKIPEKVERLL